MHTSTITLNFLILFYSLCIFVNILYLCLLFLWAGCTTFVPWIIPLIYVTISWLLLTWMNPLFLAVIVTSWAVGWTTLLWFANTYIDKKLQHLYPKFSYDESHRLGKKIIRIHKQLHIYTKKRILFFLVACTTWSAIPDILIIRTVRHKLPFPYFFWATLIWKFFVYTPFIYGIELIEALWKYITAFSI